MIISGCASWGPRQEFHPKDLQDICLSQEGRGRLINKSKGRRSFTYETLHLPEEKLLKLAVEFPLHAGEVLSLHYSPEGSTISPRSLGLDHFLRAFGRFLDLFDQIQQGQGGTVCGPQWTCSSGGQTVGLKKHSNALVARDSQGLSVRFFQKEGYYRRIQFLSPTDKVDLFVSQCIRAH